MGERQGIAQKGVRAIDARKAAAINGESAAKTQCSGSRAVNRSVWTPFCVILWGWLRLGKNGHETRETAKRTKWLQLIYTEQMDAEGLGRKLLLTPSGDPHRTWRQIWRVAGRESGYPELLGSPRTSPEVPQTSPEVFRRLPRKFSHCGTLQQSRGSPEVSQTSPEVPRTSPEVSPFLWEARHPLLTHKNFLWKKQGPRKKQGFSSLQNPWNPWIREQKRTKEARKTAKQKKTRKTKKKKNQDWKVRAAPLLSLGSLTPSPDPQKLSLKNPWNLAHQNRTIAIASDFRVDEAQSPEIP